MCVLCAVLTGCMEFNTQKWWKEVTYGAAITTLAADWGQTRYISKHPNTYYELNPILGRHPQISQVDSYFGAVTALTMISYPFVKDSYAPYIYGSIAILEAVVVSRNMHKGIRMDWELIKW